LAELARQLSKALAELARQPSRALAELAHRLPPLSARLHAP